MSSAPTYLWWHRITLRVRAPSCQLRLTTLSCSFHTEGNFDLPTGYSFKKIDSGWISLGPTSGPTYPPS